MTEQQTMYERMTPDGTPLDEAVSALTKELRRGRELEALFWAQQIEAKFYRYVWRRLIVFAAEDIGLADPTAVVTVKSLRDSYLDMKSESRRPPDENLLAFAVLLLATSPKNREADDLKNVLGALRKEARWRPEVPPEAIDGHTKQGRDRDNGRDDGARALLWFRQGSLVFPWWGPRDARLWHLRNLARRGLMSSAWVEQKALDWEESGHLRYGVEGRYPRVPEDRTTR